eukprot:5347166-Pyramimonas_sp.AAC.1
MDMEVEFSVSQRTRWSVQPSCAWYLSIPSRPVSNSRVGDVHGDVRMRGVGAQELVHALLRMPRVEA